MNEKKSAWDEGATKLKTSLIRCPNCHKSIGYLNSGESFFYCRGCKGLVRADIGLEKRQASELPLEESVEDKKESQFRLND